MNHIQQIVAISVSVKPANFSMSNIGQTNFNIGLHMKNLMNAAVQDFYRQLHN